MLLVRQPPPKCMGHMLSMENSRANGPALRLDVPWLGRSAVEAQTVRPCAVSVRVPSFSQDLLPKTVGLARETICSGSRPPPLYR
jgi:hypothetical protein